MFNFIPLYNHPPSEFQVLVALHHEGAVISSRETKGAPCSLWNSSFLFDLPPGDISKLHLMLEFVIVQVKKGCGGAQQDAFVGKTI